jgi:hypothetical protein
MIYFILLVDVIITTTMAICLSVWNKANKGARYKQTQTKCMRVFFSFSISFSLLSLMHILRLLALVSSSELQLLIALLFSSFHSLFSLLSFFPFFFPPSL